MALSPDQLKRLSALLDAALDRPESMRASWLQQLDLDDPALLAMLQSALREDSDGSVGGRSDAAAYWLRSGRLSTLFATAASASAGQAPVESTPALAGGSAIGHYRLLREIGTGGMGVVWLAERSVGDIVRPVAIKLPLAMGAPRQIAERFHRERGVLARLAHPNIATLYDAGISDGGTPFLALEYVEGQTITRYCDTHRMTVSGRLELFGQVLSAVQHAHGRLVIHRDLKPANILVTAEGTVKLLDFGIAKLLEGDGVDDDLTRQVGVAITPNYASPEQLAGEPLTIATDLYSLGVVLYELLTGARPYHFKRDGQAALAQAIIAADIVPPSAAPIAADAAARRGTTMPRLRKMLRGDIDAITVKALEKPVARRYETAGAFAEDVAHHLRNEAVGAASAGASYRLRKFLLRHRVGVAAGSVAIAAVVAGSSVALWNLRETQRELMRRTTVQSFLIDMFKAADPEIARGRRYTAVDLLDRAGTRIGPTFAAEPEIEAALYGEVGAIYSALGKWRRRISIWPERSRRSKHRATTNRRTTSMHSRAMAAMHSTRASIRKPSERSIARSSSQHGWVALRIASGGTRC